MKKSQFPHTPKPLPLPKLTPEYLTFAQWSRALPAFTTYSEKQFLDHGRKKDSKLKFVRLAGRYSDAAWRVSDLIEWGNRVWKNAPELAAEFEAKLNALPKNDF